MTRDELKRLFKGKQEKFQKQKNGTLKLVHGFKIATFDEFLEWHTTSNFNNGCHYCGLTNEESLTLFNLRNKATRGGKRGKRLELDRRDPIQPYDNLNNLVWCCYWCNNAKSNFFSEEEFKSIAVEIGSQLIRIINNNV